LKYHKEKYSLKKSYSLTNHTKWRMNYVNGLIRESDRTCIDHLRMDRHTFFKLCSMQRTIGRLDDSKYMPLEEQVAFFLVFLCTTQRLGLFMVHLRGQDGLSVSI